MSVFRSATLRNFAVGLLLLAFGLRVALARGAGLGYLRNGLMVPGVALLCLVFASVLYSPDVRAALVEYGQTFGMIAFGVVVTPYVLREERQWKRLLVVAGLTALYLNFVQIKGVFVEHARVGHWLHDVSWHRPHSVTIMFYLPFVLALASLERGRRAAWWWAAVVLQLVLLVMTTGRAATLGVAVALALWMSLRADRRIIGLLAAGALLGGMVLVAAPDDSFIRAVLHDPLRVRDRTDLTWGPATAMILEHPFAGYGYGAGTYPPQFEQQVPRALIWADWEWAKQLGPHNYYLEIWFTSGVAALAALIVLFAMFAGRMLRLASEQCDSLRSLIALAVLCSFTAFYLVHAHLGPLGPNGLRPLGLLLGFGLALLHWRSDAASGERAALKR
jgi:O-antigen ligase